MEGGLSHGRARVHAAPAGAPLTGAADEFDPLLEWNGDARFILLSGPSDMLPVLKHLLVLAHHARYLRPPEPPCAA
jgi:hypothetical protein